MKTVRSMLPLLALGMLVTAAPVYGQTSQPATAPYIETFDVRLHDLDVIVTDRAGKPVSGLRKEDFEVFESGQPQKVTNFTVYGDSTGVTSSQAGAVAAPDAAEPANKRFIFFIDELALHPYTRRKLIVHATKLIRTSMKPGDEAMIITPAAEEKVALAFTSDVNVVAARLEAVLKATGSERALTQHLSEERFLERQLAAAPRSDTRYGDSSIEHQRRQIKRMYARAANRRVDQRLGQLRSIVAALGEVPGRKVLILATESLSATPGLEAFRADSEREQLPAVDSVQNDGALDMGREASTLEEATGDDSRINDGNNRNWADKRRDIRDIARKASTNGITIYAMQPEFGLPLAAPGGLDTRAGTRSGVLNPTFMNASASGTEITLSMLSDLTGGKWYRGDGPVDDAFRQVATDLSTYYSLGYPAPEGKQDVARAISVRVKGRPELNVRVRKELVEKSLTQEMTDQVVASLLVPRGKNELAIDVKTNAAPFDGHTRLVHVDVNVPMDKLLFLPDGNDTYKAQFSVHYAAAGQTADFMAGENRNQYIAISAADYAKIAGKSWKYSTRLRVPRGQMSIAVGVMDMLSRLTGFQTVRLPAVQTASKR